MSSNTTVIEADLDSEEGPPGVPEQSCDPVARALRRQGFRYVSVGLQTAQVDGLLYELCPAGQAAVGGWLRGERVLPRTRIHLVRHSIRQAK
jgi:hypothetical protein